MPKSDTLILSFNGGEISEKLDARADLQKYNSSCQVLENFIPLVEGAAQARPGLYYVAEIKDSSKAARLFPFQFSTVKAYIILAEEGQFRFFAENAQIVSAPSTPYEVTNAYTSGQLSDIKITQSADILYLAHRDNYLMKMTRTSDTTWTFTKFIAVTGEELTITGATQANPCVVTVTPDADNFPANDDIVYIEDVVGMTELNGLFFTVANGDSVAGTFQLSGINSSAYTAYTSGGTAVKSLFGTTGNNPGAIAFFEQRFMAGGTENNPLDVYGSCSADFENFIQDASDDSAAIEYSLLSDKVDSINWMLGEEYLMIGTQGGIWRLGASSTSNPLTGNNVVAKRQLSFGAKDMDAEMIADSIIFVQRGGTTVRRIVWKWEQDKYTAMDTTRISKHITKGTSTSTTGIVDMDYQSEPISILWAVRADGQLLGMVYEPDENIYPWFRVITDGYFESVAVITGEDEEDQVWVIVRRTIDGQTKRYVEYFKPHEIFNVYEDAFFVDSGLTWDGGAAKTITGITNANPCVVTCQNHGFTNGWKVRITGVGGMTEINQGLTAAYTVANKTDHTFELSGFTSEAWGTYTSGGTAQRVTNSISGYTHLKGKTVAVLTNYGKHPDIVVSDLGVLSLSYYANVVTAGLPYDYNLMPMKIEPGTRTGASRGRKKKIYSLTTSFYQSAGVQWGPDEDNLFDVPFGVGATPTLYTGDKETDFNADYDTGASIYIRGTSPLPCTILSVALRMEVAGD